MLLPQFCSSCLAGVIAKVVDGRSTHGCGGRCYSQSGRWNGHWVNILISILMFSVGPHPVYEADGIWLYSSHHTIPSKYSVAGTLFHRVTTVWSNSQLLQEEEKHLIKALKR